MDPHVIFNRALDLARSGDAATAARLLDQLEALEEPGAETLRLMGKVHLRLGDLGRARECWRKAVRLDPGDTGTAACLARVSAFDRGRRIAVAGVLLLLAVVAAAALWLHLKPEAEAVQAVGLPAAAASPEPRGAMPTGAPAVERAQTDTPPLEQRYRAALQLALDGKLEEARAGFEALVPGLRDSDLLAPNIHFWLGRCLVEIGESELALAEFGLLLERWPDSAKAGEALLSAGRSAAKLGRNERAREHWDRLLDGNYDEALKAAARRQIAALIRGNPRPE